MLTTGKREAGLESSDWVAPAFPPLSTALGTQKMHPDLENIQNSFNRKFTEGGENESPGEGMWHA